MPPSTPQDPILVALTCFDAGEAVGRLGAVPDAWSEGYNAGFAEGQAYADTRRDAALADHSRRLVHHIAGRPDFATLCERRGDPKRAMAARARLAGLGVTP